MVLDVRRHRLIDLIEYKAPQNILKDLMEGMRGKRVKDDESRLFGLNTSKNGMNSYLRQESLRQEQIQEGMSCSSRGLWKHQGNREMRPNGESRVFLFSKLVLRVLILLGSSWGQGKVGISELSHPK